MSRRGPGHVPFPRHGVLRVNDLVAPAVDPGRIRAALAARGVPVGTRDEPLRGGPRALVTPTGAGTVVTLEQRGTVLTPRTLVLWRLNRLWDDLARAWEGRAPSGAEPPRTRTSGYRHGS